MATGTGGLSSHYPSAAELQAIAEAHPAYTALGAIGPDMFFLLPDFKRGAAEGLWGAAQTMGAFTPGGTRTSSVHGTERSAPSP